ncbi:MAG: lipopolysaccharide heptosyltransferase II [Endomicrobiia bacterium]
MKKILIIKPSGIGDIVHSLPVAIGLKKIFPESTLHWLIFNKFASILKNVNYVDKIILWDRDGGIKEFFRVLNEIRREKYDLTIDLQGLLRTALLNRFSSAKSILATSLLREFSWLLEKPIAKYDDNLHAVERNYEVVKFLAKKEIPSPKKFLPWLETTKDEKEKAKKLLNGKSNIITFSVGSRGKHKIWPYENFIELINRMSKEIFFVPVFVGSKEEKYLVENIILGIVCPYINLVGETDLRDIVGVLEQSKLVIGNDSGIIHIAAALNKPVLAIFGATNPKWYYPYNDNSRFIYKKYKCSPCDIKTNCKDYKCMKNISVDEVFDFFKKNFVLYLK